MNKGQYLWRLGVQNLIQIESLFKFRHNSDHGPDLESIQFIEWKLQNKFCSTISIAKYLVQVIVEKDIISDFLASYISTMIFLNESSIAGKHYVVWCCGIGQ